MAEREVTCSVCLGGGKRRGKPCPACKGKGTVPDVRPKSGGKS